ncbi:MAG: hypothetical protein HY319_25465 [Armatimonadetes bacterium]|nr:hypothetical protein [Armatimonadota bacterium]
MTLAPSGPLRLGPSAQAAAARVALTLTPPTAAAALQLAEQAHSQGVEFSRRKRFLFWNRTGWQPATPAQAARLARQENPLRAAHGASDPADVSGVSGLRVVHALYVGEPRSLPDPSLAEAALALEQAGADLQGQSAYGLYQSPEPPCIALSGQKFSPRDAEGVVACAVLTGLLPPNRLPAAERASSLQALQDASCSLSTGTAFDTYEALREADRPVEVTARDVCLMRVNRADLDSPGFKTRLQSRLQDLALVESRFEDPRSAWEILDRHPERSFRERAGLLADIQKTGTLEPERLLAAVLETPGRKPEDALALARALPGECSREAAELYRLGKAGPEALEACADFKLLHEIVPLSEDVRSGVLHLALGLRGAERARLLEILKNVVPWQFEGPCWKHENNLLSAGVDALHQAHGTAATRAPVPAGQLRLDYEADFSLCDYAQLDSSTDGGKTWAELRRFEGAKKDQLGLTLPEPALLRFSISRSFIGKGLTVRNLQIGEQSVEKLLVAPDIKSLTRDLERLDPAQREPAFEALGRLSAAVPWPGALSLWQALLPASQAPWPPADLEDRVGTLLELARLGGVEPALQAWPEVAALEPAARHGAPERAKQLGERLKNAAAGVRLLPCVLPHPGEGPAEEALAGLAACVGLDRAAEAWRTLEREPGAWADRLRVFESAWHLNGGDLEGALQDFHAWRPIVVDPTAAEALASFSARVTGWSSKGDWRTFGAEGLHVGHGYQVHRPAEFDSFVVPPGAALSLDEQHFFEFDDNSHLQLSVEGGEWQDLAVFNGTGKPQTHKFPLDACAGRSVRVRFTMDKTYSVSDLKVESFRLNGEPLAACLCRDTRDRVNRLLSSSDSVPERLRLLADLAGTTQNAQEATLLYGCLEPHVGTPELPAWRDRLARLVELGGVRRAAGAWSRLSAQEAGSVDAAITALQALGEELKQHPAVFELLTGYLADPGFPDTAAAAGRLVGLVGADKACQVWKTLQAHPGSIEDGVGLFTFCYRKGAGSVPEALETATRSALAPGVGRRLGPLLDSFALFEPEGHWAETRGEDGERNWTCTPASGYQEHSAITSRPLNLAGLENSVLRLEAQHGFYEYLDDCCHLEVSQDATTWQPLRKFERGARWTVHEVPLPTGDSIQLRFRMDKKYDLGDGFSLRNLSIGGRSLPGLAAPDLVDGLWQLATEVEADEKERSVALLFLQGLPPAGIEKVMEFCRTHRDAEVFPRHTYSEIVARLASTPMGGAEDLDAQLTALLLPATEGSGVDVTEEDVLINGVRVRRRREGS